MRAPHSPASDGHPCRRVDTVDADTAAHPNGVSVSSVNGVSTDVADLVHAYTRAEALADGVLIDVTDQASPAGMLGGFMVPVAVTAAVWQAVHAIPHSLDGLADARGRLHDVLWMASVSARLAGAPPSRAFQVILPYRGTRQRVQTLRIAIGPGDDGRPVVTIGFPEDF